MTDVVGGIKRVICKLSRSGMDCATSNEVTRSTLIMESTSDLIWATDVNRKVYAYNRAFKDELFVAFGIQICIGETIVDNPLLPAEERDFWNSVYKRVNLGESFIFERSYNYGTPIVVEVSASPVSRDEKIVGAVFVSRDITKKRQEVQMLKEGMSEAIKIIESNGHS